MKQTSLSAMLRQFTEGSRVVFILVIAVAIGSCGLEENIIRQSEERVQQERDAEFARCLRETGHVEKCR